MFTAIIFFALGWYIHIGWTEKKEKIKSMIPFRRKKSD